MGHTKLLFPSFSNWFIVTTEDEKKGVNTYFIELHLCIVSHVYLITSTKNTCHG